VRILDAYELATGGDRLGAVMFEGEMIDEASRKMAQQVVARGRAAAPSA
jgi:citrate lyase subunit beta/citryl-CoA lyase